MGKRIFVKVGEYEKDGQTKPDLKAIGELFTGKNGKEYGKLYSIPGQLLYVYEDKPKPAQQDGGLAPDENVPF